jgi:phenylpropionate dioxygenase-like ring-hydroxylating dioxygenase large terminal subunit
VSTTVPSIPSAPSVAAQPSTSVRSTVTPLRPRMVAPDDRLPPGLGDLFELFWHPVCTVDELASVSPHPLAVQLLGRSLAIARTGTGLVALADRCIHRSARLSVGWVDGDTVRCGYHGWAYGGDGRCREIPSMPDGPIPERACVPSFDVEERHGLVWVRLDGSAGTSIPLTVSIEFWLANGAYRHLWMTASPIDMGTCRAFWTVSRDDDLDGDDAAHMAFQAQVLAEDEPVVCNQVPRELVLEPGFELSVRTDRVSIEYRRWLSELVHALALGPERVRAVLNGS